MPKLPGLEDFARHSPGTLGTGFFGAPGTMKLELVCACLFDRFLAIPLALSSHSHPPAVHGRRTIGSFLDGEVKILQPFCLEHSKACPKTGSASLPAKG
jgi:hypothetical protein